MKHRWRCLALMLYCCQFICQWHTVVSCISVCQVCGHTSGSPELVVSISNGRATEEKLLPLLVTCKVCLCLSVCQVCVCVYKAVRIILQQWTYTYSMSQRFLWKKLIFYFSFTSKYPYFHFNLQKPSTSQKNIPLLKLSKYLFKVYPHVICWGQICPFCDKVPVLSTFSNLYQLLSHYHSIWQCLICHPIMFTIPWLYPTLCSWFYLVWDLNANGFHCTFNILLYNSRQRKVHCSPCKALK